ncbi:MAG: slipin family protein, partial [Nanoarchaeota archaeon]|nr:slipin family protein [Nanoarchaeota archaeon]
MVLLWIIGAIVLFFLTGLKVVNEYERGVRFTLGKYSGIMSPGLKLVIPILQTWQRVDMRIKAVDVPEQDAITKDNVSVNVNAVLYYKVAAAESAILKVEHFGYAVSQLAQTTMRDVVGEV